MKWLKGISTSVDRQNFNSTSRWNKTRRNGISLPSYTGYFIAILQLSKVRKRSLFL